MSLLELRILPALAFARLGSAEDPLDNYDVVLDPADTLGPRRLVPARTLRLDPASGEIAEAFVPDAVRFKDGDAVRPVAPFLELWALTAPGVLEPVTLGLLGAHGLGPEDVRWSVHVANHGIRRRTHDARDEIDAHAGPFADHARHELRGECEHFWPGRTLPFGWVQYVRPTEAFPEIRLRFTPARGAVYGSSREPPGDDESLLYDASRGTWLGFKDPGDPLVTSPPNIYARQRTELGQWESTGLFDDKCDGVVHVALPVEGGELRAFGRIVSSPPKYAPDAMHLRTVADELDQAMHGPEVEPAEATLERIEEILRRACEAVRLINAPALNGNAGAEDQAITMVGQDSSQTGRRFEPIMAASLVDSSALLELHRAVLTALRSGTAAWFVDAIRRFDEVGDLTATGRRKMPALMRGSDGRHLTLTRRQYDLIRQVAQGPIFPAGDARPGP